MKSASTRHACRTGKAAKCSDDELNTASPDIEGTHEVLPLHISEEPLRARRRTMALARVSSSQNRTLNHASMCIFVPTSILS